MAAELENALLETSLSEPGSIGLESAVGTPALRHLYDDIAEGRYAAVLRSDTAAALLGGSGTHPEQTTGVAGYFESVPLVIHAALEDSPEMGGQPSRQQQESALQALTVAVAALYAFLQANLTGPPDPSLPECPAQLLATDGTAPTGGTGAASHVGGSSPADSGTGTGQAAASADDRWAVAQLSASGEEVVGVLARPQYLLLALTILLPPLGHDPCAPSGLQQPGPGTQHPWLTAALPSWRWWAARALMAQQRALGGRAAAIQSALDELMPAVLQHYDGVAATEGGIGPAHRMAAAAHLESAMIEHAFSRVVPAEAALRAAGAAAGIQVELTGAMGTRTVHQLDAKAQMVVEVLSQGTGEGADSGDEASALDAVYEGAALAADMKGLGADVDVLPAPRIEGGGGGRLGSLEQAILLGWAAQVGKGTSVDELQAWQMAPYVEAVLSQPRSRPLLRAAAKLYKERALLTLQQLADAASAPQPHAGSRMRYAFSVAAPYSSTLRRELGEQLVSCGMIGAAMSLFEELELWDNLILCYQLLQKKPQAESLIRCRLEVTPGEARLWCALGDLNLDDSCYRKAWELSGQRSARAQRSLARSAMRRKDHVAAAEHWEATLAISPLHPDGWFSLGYCLMKSQRHDRALQAFTRTTQLEPDNGDAWNNIAAIHLQRGSFPAAFSALAEAVKYRRESWQTWSNYALAAAQTGAWAQALRGAQQVAQLTDGQHLETEVLQALVTALGRLRSGMSVGSGIPAGAAEQGSPSEEEAGGASGEEEEAAGPDAARSPLQGVGDAAQQQREVEQLERGLGQFLKASVTSPAADSSLWGILADFYTLTGFPESAREAALKRVRALQGAGWLSDPARFQALAVATLALCQAAVDAAAAGGASQRDLASGRMQLRGLVKPAREQYEDMPVFSELEEMLLLVERLEGAFVHQK